MLNQIHKEDCVAGMKRLLPNSVQVIVTSPPYNVDKPYLSYKDNLAYDKYKKFMKDTFNECFRVLAPTGVLFVNISNCRDNQVKAYDVAYLIREAGFELIDTIIWNKPNPRYYNTDRMLTNAYEFVFMFAKSKNYAFDKHAIGVPCIHSDKLKCRTNVWTIPKPTFNQFTSFGHCAMFPVELPELCIKLCSKEQDTVLDPFMGAGTTAVAAKILNRNFVGFDICEDYINIANKRLEAVKNETLD